MSHDERTLVFRELKLTGVIDAGLLVRPTREAMNWLIALCLEPTSVSLSIGRASDTHRKRNQIVDELTVSL